MHARLTGAVLCLLFTTAAHAEGRAHLVFGKEYTCNNGDTHLIVKKCAPLYTFQSCDVQYLNAYSPNGLGALVQMHQEDVEHSLAKCTIGGAAVQTHAEDAGHAGQALYLGTWYDVKILERVGNKIRVRWSSGTEDLLDASSVRENAPVRAAGYATGPIRPGSYSCSSYGHAMPSFSVGLGGSYTDRNGARGTITLGAKAVASFHGGNLDGQAAFYEAPRGDRSVLRLYNERRSATVIDCEGPG